MTGRITWDLLRKDQLQQRAWGKWTKFHDVFVKICNTAAVGGDWLREVTVTAISPVSFFYPFLPHQKAAWRETPRAPAWTPQTCRSPPAGTCQACPRTPRGCWGWTRCCPACSTPPPSWMTDVWQCWADNCLLSGGSDLHWSFLSVLPSANQGESLREA